SLSRRFASLRRRTEQSKGRRLSGMHADRSHRLIEPARYRCRHTHAAAALAPRERTMTMQQNNGPQGPPPGHYLATDGRYYPVPAGHVLGADGNVYPVAATSPTRTSAWEWNAASFLTL